VRHVIGHVPVGGFPTTRTPRELAPERHVSRPHPASSTFIWAVSSPSHIGFAAVDRGNVQWGDADTSMHVQRVYLTLLLLHTLAASFIWGINTLFLLDAGLSNGQAFAANAFFTAGLVLFEVPTGVIADIRGRRFSYLLGTLTLTISTVLYVLMWRSSADFWAWAVASALLGLGFTFFSGAVQAWLVDALKAGGFTGQLDSVFARGKIVEGIAMLTGSVAGGYLAQVTNLGIPYVVRAVVLVLSFVLAFILMRDVGFTPKRTHNPISEVKNQLSGAITYGFRNPPVRWVMLGNIFTDGVSIYAFYAMQPYLLQLYGDPKAYGVAGLAAAIVGGAQIGGGLLVPHLGRSFSRRTSVLLMAAVLNTVVLASIGFLPRFWIAIVLLVLWGLVFATVMPVRQAYVNELIPSEHRATVLSVDSLMGSSGGVVMQPVLGRTADAWGYPVSYVCSAAIQALAIPAIALARRERAESDPIPTEEARSRS
jgi:MFS family permease